jgi:hypothetical protein
LNYLNQVLKQHENLAKAMEETRYFFGLTFEGSIKDFEAVKEYIAKFTSLTPIYQVKSIEYLMIFRRSKVPPEMLQK